jgi:hypothetical protein
MMLKIADLGLARAFTLPIKKYTHEVIKLMHACYHHSSVMLLQYQFVELIEWDFCFRY